MKEARTEIDINDFSKGLVTNIPVLNLPLGASPDCLNVYPEGVVLRRRDGFSNVNTSSVGTGKQGNGIFNWVKNSSNQLLMAVFGNTLYSMDQAATTWDGTFDTIGADANGTAFGDSIVHFVNYSGVLLFTTEGRDKPQRMTVSDASHFNIDYNGVGTAPNAKYIQIWKEHVWLLNLGGGGVLTENANNISTWTDNDTSTGASTQTTFSSQETFRFLAGGTAGHDAKRTRDLGTLADNFTIEMRTYFDVLNTVASGDYAAMDVYNGVIKFQVRWSDDGLEVFNGSAWVEVGVDIVAEDAFAVWKFFITGASAATARVEVMKDGNYVGLGFSIANADVTNDGQIDLFAEAGGSGTATDWYLDYIYINSSNAVTEYFTDGDFGDWTDVNSPTTPTEHAAAGQPLVHIKFNDNAASTVVTNDGTNTDAGVLSVNTDAITSTGKISNSFSFTSASSHNIALAAATVTAMRSDGVGSLGFWVNPDVIADDDFIFVLQDANVDSGFKVSFGTGSQLQVVINSAGVTDLDVRTTSALASVTWTHVQVIQNGTEIAIRLNDVAETLVYATSTDRGAWFDDAGGSALDTGRIARSYDTTGAANANFYDGQLDDFRYFSRALTSFGVSTIYKSSSGTESAALTVRQGTTFKVGTFAYEMRVIDSSDNCYASQLLSAGSALGATASIFGAWTQGSSGTPYYLRVIHGTAITTGSTISGNGAWQYNSLAFTPASGTTAVRAVVGVASVGTVYIDQASVIASSVGITDDLSDRIQRSDVGDYTSWSGGDSGTNDIRTDGDIGLTGSAILGDKMFVFKKYSIHQFTYTGSTPLVDIKIVASRMGTSSPRSIKNVEIPGVGEIIVFLGTDRMLYAFDGFELSPIGDPIFLNNSISSVYLQNINTAALDKVFAVVHDRFPWYEIFLPLGSDVLPEDSIIYDYKAKAFFPQDNKVFKSGTIADRGDGLREVYCLETTTGIAVRTMSTNSDDATAINSYWVSGKIGKPTMLARIDEVNVTTESIASVSPTFDWRADYETSYVSNTIPVSTNNRNYSIGRIDNFIQFRVAQNTVAPSFKLWSIVGLTKALGHGR